VKRLLVAPGVLLAAVIAYLLMWPVPINPVAWDAPVDRGLVDPFAANDRLRYASGIALGDHIGPEDATLGLDGKLYATTQDGLILSIDSVGHYDVFADVGGRPLGIETAPDGALIVANAYLGVQRINPDGSVTMLLDKVGDRPLVYADDIAIASDGTIYVSEASTRFGASQYGGTYAAALLDIMEHGGHGQVIEFRPETGAARVLVNGLNFANGLAISDDQAYLLIAETGSYRILKHWLRGADTGRTEVLVDNLPGFPDNINNGLQGRFWIGLAAPRDALLDDASDIPLLRKIAQRLPERYRPAAAPSSHVFAVNGNGDVLMDLQDPDARFSTLTGVLETANALYLTSLFGRELGILLKEDL
jgi:sugar lactone lactonase YvrE